MSKLLYESELIYSYNTTRAILANAPGAGSCLGNETFYRCIRCHRLTTSERRAMRHVRWRWLTDWGKKI